MTIKELIDKLNIAHGVAENSTKSPNKGSLLLYFKEELFMKRFQKLDDTSRASIIIVTWAIAFDAAVIFCTAIWWLIFIFVSLSWTMYLIYDTKLEQMEKRLERKKKIINAMHRESMNFAKDYEGKERKNIR